MGMVLINYGQGWWTGGGDVDSDYSYLKNSNIIVYIFTIPMDIVGVVDHSFGRNITAC